MNIAELKRKSIPQLHDLAESLELPSNGALDRQALIFRIEQKLLDQEEILVGEGVLEVLPEGYGFLRSQDWNYLYSPDDIYVSPSQIKRFDLKTGDTVRGQVRPPKEWERYLALLKVENVNGGEPEAAKARIAFDNLRPRYPQGRLRLESSDGDLSMRVMDLVAPIGKGQRGLIVAPPRTGKTMLLQNMARGIWANYGPQADGSTPPTPSGKPLELCLLLVDERPEEVTDMKRNVPGTVYASSNDNTLEKHLELSQLVIERC